MLQITVDTSKATQRFSSAGIPEQVRKNLRALIPDLTKQLGANVEARLDSELKTRRRLVVKKFFVDGDTRMYGMVRLTTKAPPALLPTWLEAGTPRHPITAKYKPRLKFFWERVGHWVSPITVNHPGTKQYNFLHGAFAEMEGEIRAKLEEGVRKAVGK